MIYTDNGKIFSLNQEGNFTICNNIGWPRRLNNECDELIIEGLNIALLHLYKVFKTVKLIEAEIEW